MAAKMEKLAKIVTSEWAQWQNFSQVSVKYKLEHSLGQF